MSLRCTALHCWVRGRLAVGALASLSPQRSRIVLKKCQAPELMGGVGFHQYLGRKKRLLNEEIS